MKARTRATIATPCAVALLSAASADTAADGGYIDGTDRCTAHVIVTEHSAKAGRTSLDPCDSHAVRGKFQGNSGPAQWSKWVKSGAALLVLALSGCSGDGEPAPGASPSVDWSGYSQLVTEVVEEAKAGGASAEQIAALEQIAAAGEITYADLEQRMQATFACFEASGIPYSYEPPAEGIDYPEGMYFHGDAEGISEDQSLAIADDCIYRESFYVDTAYQFSPAVTARRDREDQAHLPAAIECVKELGIDPGDADTMSELSAVVDESGNNAAADCLVPPEQMVAWD